MKCMAGVLPSTHLWTLVKTQTGATESRADSQIEVSKTRDQLWFYVTALLLAQDSLSKNDWRIIHIRKVLLLPLHVASFGSVITFGLTVINQILSAIQPGAVGSHQYK